MSKSRYTGSEAERERRRAYYIANRERIIARAKAWNRAHPRPNGDSARVKAYLAANPDRARAIFAAGKANKRAKAAGIDGRLTHRDVLAVWARQPTCVGCGVGRGLDHIVPLSRGGANDPKNLQNLCVTCNVAKGRRSGTGVPPRERVVRGECAHCAGPVYARRQRFCCQRCWAQFRLAHYGHWGRRAGGRAA